MQTPIDVSVPQTTSLPVWQAMSAGDFGSIESLEEDVPLTDRKSVRKVLIADDSLTERTNLCHILESVGLEVIQAVSGNEAIELAIKHEPDLVILDIIMEDGDGYKACRNLKRNNSTAKTPVIMLSSKSNPVDIKWAQKLGADDYVIKPYSEDEILRKIKAL